MFDSFFATGTVCFCKFILLATDTLLTANAIILFIENVFFFFDSIVCQAQRHREREKLRERDIKRELWKVVLFAQRGCDGGMLQRIHHEQNRYVTTKAMNYTHAKKKIK